MIRNILFLTCLIAGCHLSAQNADLRREANDEPLAFTTYNTTKSGDWSENDVWTNAVAPPLTLALNDIVNIYNKVNADGDIILAAFSELNVYDTLTIDGSFGGAFLSVFNVYSGGYFRINGNILNTTWGDGLVDGTLLVEGDFFNSGTSGMQVGENAYVGVAGDLINDGTFENDGTLNVGGTISGITPVSGSGTTTEGHENPLPVELIYFSVGVQHSTVTLNWATATELNNDYFEIQRSRDGINWKAIKKIAGAGNSMIKTEYRANDNPQAPGGYYYRLLQVDFDGSSTASKMVSAFVMQDEVAPKFVVSGTQLKVEESYEKLAIYDIHGKLLKTVYNEPLITGLQKGNLYLLVFNNSISRKILIP